MKLKNNSKIRQIFLIVSRVIRFPAYVSSQVSVDLSNSSTTTDLDFDINSGESFGAANQKWFLELESESFWLDFVERSSVDFDEAFAGFAESDSGGSLLSAVNLDVVAVSWGWHFKD